MTIEEIQTLLLARTQRGAKDFYKPLSIENSTKIREWYEINTLSKFTNDAPLLFTNKINTVLAQGVPRVVIGDYGSYYEFSNTQIISASIKQKWSGAPRRATIKYLWHISDDALETKLYEQLRTVSYADYKPNHWYISPVDLLLNGEPCFAQDKFF